MAVPSKATELRNLPGEELADKLREAKAELFNLRFQAATGQLENHGRLRRLRRDIARIYTVVRERELGITEYVGEETEAQAEPAAEEAAAEPASSQPSTAGGAA